MTKKRFFFCFLCFFKKILAPFIEKTGFAKCTKSSRCLHFERFKAIESSIYSVLMAILYWVFRFWKNCVFYLDRYAYCIFIVIFHKKHEKTRFFLQFSHFRGMLIEKVKVIMQGKAKLPSDLDRIEHTWNSCGVGLNTLEARLLSNQGKSPWNDIVVAGGPRPTAFWASFWEWYAARRRLTPLDRNLMTKRWQHCPIHTLKHKQRWILNTSGFVLDPAFPRRLIPVHFLESFWQPNSKAFGKIPMIFVIF